MKKTILTISLILAAVASQAAALTVFSGGDYERSISGKSSEYDGRVGASLGTSYGSFDAALLGRELVSSKNRDNNVGFEVGYSNGMKLGPVSLTGRAAFGRINLVNGKAAVLSYKGNSEYLSVGAEGGLRLTPDVSAFVGYRFTDGLNAVTPIQNRVTAGADVSLTKQVGLRVGYLHDVQIGTKLNGVTTSLSYKF